jgi:hypothetical protein
MEKFEQWLAKKPVLWRWYCALNFCKETYADGRVKVDGFWFRLFSRVFYLKCSCCSALRGLVVGFGLATLVWEVLLG